MESPNDTRKVCYIIPMASSILKTFVPDENMIKKEFSSWKEFCDFFDDWCEQNMSLFFVKYALPITRCDWLKLKPEVKASLKFSKVRLHCRSGWYHKGELRKGYSCPASVFLKLNTNQDKLHIYACSLRHNHLLCPVTFSFYFKRGVFWKNSGSRSRIIHVMNEVSNKFLIKEDIRRFLSVFKTYENRELQDLISALDNITTLDPGAKVKLIFVKDVPVLKSVFILTSEMQTICQRLPLLLIFDHMGSVNEFDLFSLLCVDTDHKGREAALFLTQKDTPDVLRFTLVSVLQSIPDIKLKVQCMTLGASIAEAKVVNELLPKATVHICHSQVMDTLHTMANNLGLLDNEIICSFLYQLHKCESLDDYNIAVREWKKHPASAFSDYFFEHWDPCHHMWIKASTPVISSEVDAGEIIRLHKKTYDSAMSNSSTLSQFILDLLGVENSSSNIEDLATKYKMVCNTERGNLIEEELSFLKHDTYSMSKYSDGFSLTDGLTDFFMDLELTSCSCILHQTNLLPCRHLFFARFSTGQELFDMKLLEQNKSAVLQRDDTEKDT
ncbi:uncharacterized protein ZSWIM9-like [Discoglossus pictus]